MLHCAWYMHVDMVYYSENQGAKYAAKEGAARAVHMVHQGHVRLVTSMKPDAHVRCSSPPHSIPSPGAILCSMT